MEPVQIRRSGNLIDVAHADGGPLTKEEVALFARALTYTHRQRLYGRDAYDAATGRRTPMRVQDVRLFEYDADGRVVCGAGFAPRIAGLLEAAGLPVVQTRLDAPHPRPERYHHDWDLVMEHFAEGFRPKQEECLTALAAYESGIISAPTGMGKGRVIEMVCLLYSKARIDVVVQGKDLVQKTASTLSRTIPNVGMVGAGARSFGRVTVYSADSLHHSDGEADILLGDEVHRLAASSYARHLAKYRNSRNYGLSASPTGRFDGADLMLEGLFGPVIFHLGYPEAVALGLVCPIRVEWLDVRMDHNPCDGKKDIWRESHGIWRNQYRNQVIADKARSYPDDAQVLILVRTLEHALYLRRHLPDFALCHSEQAIKAQDLDGYRRRGLLGDDEGPMTTKRREQLRRDFEAGTIKKAIATGVWSTGVDFVNLQVLVRGDAMMSEIADVQIPGRVCRTNQVGKEVGILVDCIDQFDEGFRRKAKARRAHYEAHGWEQVLPSLPKLTG